MKKIIWLDVETSGLDKDRHGILSLSAIYEKDGKEVDSQTWEMNPVGREIDAKALAINGFTVEQIQGLQPWGDALKSFILWLENTVGIDQYNKDDKVTAAGYNVITFDLGFVESWFLAHGNKFMYSFFNRFPLDVYRVVPMLEWAGVLKHLPNRKLATVCAAMGVELDKAHDAFADITATRALGVKMAHLFGSFEQGGPW